ncbi:MAG: FAD-binding oxidoreductase [Limnoraphis robusta]|uniref:FAD-dependent oxidoreductase n=1 Tax=Limnoraphis robusta CS-951 TaxID=1637645 RepID=A0A0F5YHQ7_9CYAN|nr:FAD-binding oxidoreductase [Limnoraphis robusta]KKD38172.1 FAD-dependent oxidoreductase [Limnoraphis robusta CS-951]
MINYDWIIVGAGITGTSLSYELAKKGLNVLLIEENPTFENATRYSYGGLAYWSGSTPLTRQLCEDGKQRHQILSEELEADTEFREVDLVLTVSPEQNPEKIAENYARFITPPRLLTPEDACQIEPLLNPNGIAAAFTVRHGHISPEKTNFAYLDAFKRLGGTLEIAKVTEFVKQENRITGVKTKNDTYLAENTVICAGGLTRSLLASAGISIRLHFTHTEVLETPPVEINLRTVVMSAGMERFQLEADAAKPEFERLWDEPGHEFVPLIIDGSAVQFLNNKMRIGQPSRVLSDPNAKVNPAESEAQIRNAIGKILPPLQDLPAHWYHCLVAFTADSLPLVGAIPNLTGIHIFSGFSNPLVFVPPLAQRYANHVTGQTDELIEQLSPLRSTL